MRGNKQNAGLLASVDRKLIGKDSRFNHSLEKIIVIADFKVQGLTQTHSYGFRLDDHSGWVH